MRFAGLSALLLLLICLSCGGNTRTSAGGGSAVDALHPEGSPQSLPALPEAAPQPQRAGPQTAPRVSAAVPLERLLAGDAAFSHSSSVSLDTGAHTATFAPPADGYAWAVYAFSDSLEPDSDFSIELSFQSGAVPAQVSLAFADYDALAWQWQSGAPVDGSISFTAPAGDLLSLSGTLYVAVVLQEPDSGVLEQLRLHSLTALPAPLGLIASDGVYSGEIRLGWQDPDLSFSAEFPGGLIYDQVSIERADGAAGPFSEIGQVGSGTTAFCDRGDGSGLPAGATYFYRLRLLKDGLAGLPSAADSGSAAQALEPASWTHTLGRPGYDSCLGSALDAAGNFYVCGTVDDSGIRAVVLKYDQTGQLLWARSYSSGIQDYGRDVEVGPDGSVFVLLQARIAEPVHQNDFCILRISPEGEMLDQWAWGTFGTESPFRLAIDSAGNPVAVGEIDVTNPLNQSAVVKFSPEGGIIWQKHYGGFLGDFGRALTIDCEGRTWVAGIAHPDEEVKDQAMVYVLSPQGNLAGSWLLGGPLNDEAAAIAVDPLGETVYVAGNTSSFGAGQQDGFVASMDAVSGALNWHAIYGGASGEYLYSLALDSAGNPYAAGATDSFGAGGTDLLLLHFDALGGLLSQECWGASKDQSGQVNCDFSGNVFIHGNARNANGAWQSIDGSLLSDSGFSAAELQADSGDIDGELLEPAGTWTELKFTTADTGAGDQDLLLMRR